MADPHFEIYKKLEDMEKQLKAIEESTDLEPTLNKISNTLDSINDSLQIFRDENEYRNYGKRFEELLDSLKKVDSNLEYIANK